MSRMVGADPDALDRLAADFDRSAGALESTAVRVRASVHANPWSGPKATRFRHDWDQRHGPLLKRTAVALRAAAKQLRLQAQEQRQASSAGGGAISGMRGGADAHGSGTSRGSDRLNATVAALMAALGVGRDLAQNLVDALDERLQRTGLTAATRDMILDSRLTTTLRLSGKLLTIVGVVQGVGDVWSGLQEDDEGKRLRGALSLSAAGLSGFPPVAFAVSAASAYGDFMLATDAEEISAVESRTMRAQFGEDVTQPYTPEQAQWLSDRYQGGGGFLNAISDQVDHGMRWMNDPIRDSAQDFRDWRHAQGWW